MPTDSKWPWRIRLGVIFALVFYATMVLVAQLYDVQMVHHERWSRKLSEQTTVPVRLSPARGEIHDRNGVPLAQNRSSFDIDLYLDELYRNFKRDNRGHVPETTIERVIRGKRHVIKQPDIVKIVEHHMRPIADSLGFELEINRYDLEEHFRTNKEIPYKFRADVDFETVAKYGESSLGMPGIDIVARPVRKYPFGALAPHILGYIGRPKVFKEHVAEDGYPYEFIGHEGIEKKMDAQLQGSPGSRILRVNYKGDIQSKEDVRRPTVGNTVKLTIDHRIQYLAEKSLRDNKVGRGAAVVVDAQNGDILAMASVPNFDPNVFIPKVKPEDWKSLSSDRTKPLMNRAVKGYPPGSTYKILIAMAGLKSGKITPATRINSPGIVYVAGHPFRDWSPSGQGNIAVHDAIRMSSNTYFYQMGVRTGIRNIAEMGRVVGFGERTGIAIDSEDPGIMPDPDWMREFHPRERWTSATTANVSIGQGYVLATPLQMALMTAAVANGGTVYQARLLDSIVNVDGETIIQVPPGRVKDELGLTPEHVEAIRKAMRAVVDNGTARRAQGTGFTGVGGKTGTAQWKGTLAGRFRVDNKAWFICFAPYDKPKYAICVMVEGGTAGGTNAAPVAREILKGVKKIEDGEDLEVAYLEPTKGHFKGSTSVSSGVQRPVIQDSGGGNSWFNRGTDSRRGSGIMMRRGFRSNRSRGEW
ncbi:MAG: penicillin-binding protein 2 [Verrucomicrobiota bacterium]